MALANIIKEVDPPVELTQAEYDALSTAQKNDGTVYYITDGNGAFQTAATTPAEDTSGGDSNVQAELNKKVAKTDIVNNFTTTQAGYAADARALKTIADNYSLKTDLSTLNTNFSRFCSVRMASKDLTTTFSLCSHESLINKDSNFFSISTNGIKILKTGYYEISASVMVRTGFSVNDLVLIQIGSSANDPVVKSQIRVQDANAWENIVIPPRIVHISANTTLGMYAKNETASRGSISGNNPVDDRITIALKQLI